jgi:hypothetical protein
MPHRDDFEDFDKETENLVAQIAGSLNLLIS